MNNILFWSIQQKPQFPAFLKTLYADAFRRDKTIIVDTDLSAQVGEGKLLERLESMPLIQAKDTLVFCFIDSIKKAHECNKQTPENYVRQLHRLVCDYPEVTFRFIEDSSNDAQSSIIIQCPKSNDAGFDCKCVCPECFIGMKDIPLKIKKFEYGERDVFDPYGIRAAIRSGKWKSKDESEMKNIETTLLSFAAKPCAYILEDEKEYLDLIGYCAYRSGKYRVRPILLTQVKTNADDFKKEFAEKGGVLIHAWDIHNLENADIPGTFAFTKDEDKEIKRMVITAAGSDVVKVTFPNKWNKPTDPWLAWIPEWYLRSDKKVPNFKELRNPLQWIRVIQKKRWLQDWAPGMKSWLFRKPPTVRGLQKPLEWIHDIQKRGLLPDWTLEGNEISTFMDGVPSRNDGHHSAKLEAQETAQQLLNRSRIALKSDEPLLAAIFSLEAIRWLRGHTSTLLLDSVQSLYEAEAELELGFGASGRSSRTEAPVQRAKELERLMKMLSGSHKMPKAQVPEMKERIWTALRRRYLEVGAFEPAESALKYIHDAHSERMGQGFFIHPNRLMYHFPKKGGGLGVLLFLAGFLIVVICRAPLIETDPLGHSGWNLSWSWPWFWSWKWFWSWSSLALVTPFIVLFALVGLWARHWPSAALSPSKWAITVFLSISVLSAGNLALLSDPSDLKMITEHRLTAYSEAVAWTCGSALAQVLPNKFIHANQDPKLPPDSISFSWRGKTRGANADSDLIAVEDTQFLRTFLWLENVIAGWLSFATGLSTIYRKASRS